MNFKKVIISKYWATYNSVYSKTVIALLKQLEKIVN